MGWDESNWQQGNFRDVCVPNGGGILSQYKEDGPLEVGAVKPRLLRHFFSRMAGCFKEKDEGKQEKYRGCWFEEKHYEGGYCD